MKVFYHITPKRNISSIIRRGLLPSTSPTLASWDLEEEDTRGRIYLAREKGEAMFNVYHAYGNPDIEGKIRSWGLLKVTLPDDWPIVEDSYGFLFTEEGIPPAFIEIEYLDYPSKKRLWNIASDPEYLDKYEEYWEKWAWR